MSNLASEITPVNIEEELKISYLDYAMSVIVGRALPDVRDGLKPVHRRVLFAMHELKNDWNKPYKKSARIVGDVIGKYHPHGDSAVYDAIVRLAQDFSMRYLLVDGQGNFGSVDGDAAAAMRYTEVRMSKITHELLTDLDKNTVDWVLNYDGNEQIPDVLPTRVPHLLVNGSSGIAVGMATNIPSHNLGEVIAGCLALIDHPDLSVDDLLQYIPGPDFATGGIINGCEGILSGYRTGRGRISVRARAQVAVNEKNGRETILVHELPYQVNKARLIEKIAELVKEKRLEGISALRDESDKDGMRIVIEIKRGESGEFVLNKLYAQTQMQNVFGINMVALEDGQPKLFNLKQILTSFIQHRREVVTRRSLFELAKARDRAHILEGLSVALANLDPVIALIRAAQTPAQAKERLLERAWQLGDVAGMLQAASGEDTARPQWLEAQYGIQTDGTYRLTEQQCQAILDLRLHKLTGLEHEKILEEYRSLLVQITTLLEILNDKKRLMAVIRHELIAIRDEYQDPRRTEITAASADLSYEDLIMPEDVVVTLSHQGYVKYQPISDYEAQRRGGKGKSAAQVKEEDFVDRLLIANTHDTILCFSSIGKVYWLKVYQLPQASRIARGRPIVNILQLGDQERITAILPVKTFDEDKFVFFATAQGTVKKTALSAFSRPMVTGIRAINLNEGDCLIGVDITDGHNEIMLFSDCGKVVRFHEQQVRAMGRTASGVRGMRLAKQSIVVSLIVPRSDEPILTVTENGYGKRTVFTEYSARNRGAQGVISIQVTERNGRVVGALQVSEQDEIMLITNAGTLVRTRVQEISVISRNTAGVRLIRTAQDEHVVGLERIEETEENEENKAFDAPE